MVEKRNNFVFHHGASPRNFKICRSYFMRYEANYRSAANALVTVGGRRKTPRPGGGLDTI
jgi:hypothetical protein